MKAGTSTRRSTTGRTRARSAGATCPSGATWPLQRRRPGARARVRHRPHRAPARPSRRAAGRHRSLGADAGSRPPACAPRAPGGSRAPDSGRYPPPAVPADDVLRDGDGAVRRPAVAPARARPGRHARRGASRARSRAARSGWSSSPTCRRGRSTGSGSASRAGSGGRGGAHVTLVETVRQDRAQATHDLRSGVHRTARAAATTRRFALTFRTLSVPQMARRLEKAGFEITALLGDYRGGAWDARADVWMILAKRA